MDLLNSAVVKMHVSGCVICRLLFVQIIVGTLGCNAPKAVLDLNAVTRFDRSVKDQLLFLEFEIRKTGSTEQMSLLRAMAAAGKLKRNEARADNPYRIAMIPRYTVSAIEREEFYPHPLYENVEVPDPGGALERRAITRDAGKLMIRMQYDHNIDRLNFYSITPENDRKKLLTLKIKP